MSKKELFRIPVTIVNAKNQAEGICMTEITRKEAIAIARDILLKAEEERMEVLDKEALAEEEEQMTRDVLEALADLNKPPGLPESEYHIPRLGLYVYQVVKLAMKDAIKEERAERYKNRLTDSEIQWVEDCYKNEEEPAPRHGNPHVFDDYSPFNNRMTRRQRDQKEKEDEG